MMRPEDIDAITDEVQRACRSLAWSADRGEAL
jgi:hypothetical protein